MWSGGGGWEHFTGSPPPHLPSIPAVAVREGGRERGKGVVQYLFLLDSAATLFRNTAARPLESNRQGLKCDKLGGTS